MLWPCFKKSILSDKAFQNVNSKCYVTGGIQGRSGYGREGVDTGKLLSVFSNFILCCSLKKYIIHECNCGTIPG